MPTYTERLKLINPDVGACNWDYPLKRNRYILDLVDAQDMNSNFVVDGCEVTAGAGLTVDITSGNVNIAGTVYAVAAGNVAVVAASADPEQFNFVYVDSAGALKVYPTDAMPSGDFAVIALVDTDLTSVLRIGDLRRWASEANSEEGLDSLVTALIPLNWREVIRTGWTPHWFNQQWGGAPYGDAYEEVATGAIADNGSVTTITGSNVNSAIVVSRTTAIHSVKVKLNKGTTNPTGSITATLNGQIATVDVKTLGESSKWVVFNFGTPPSLTAGTSYNLNIAFGGSSIYWCQVNDYPLGGLHCVQLIPTTSTADGTLNCYEGSPLNQSGAVTRPVRECCVGETVCYSLKVDSPTDGKPLLDMIYGLAQDRILLKTHGAVASLYVFDSVGLKIVLTGTTSLLAAEHTIGILVEDGKQEIWVDGVLEDSSTIALSFSEDFKDKGNVIVGGGLPNNVAWTKETNMSVLPSADGWTWNGTATEANAMSVVDGKLYQNKNGYGSSDSGYYNITTSFNNSVGWCVGFKMSSFSSDKPVSFQIQDSTYVLKLIIAKNYIAHDVSALLVTTYQLDNTTERVFTVVGKGSDFYMFCNGKLVIDGTGKLSLQASTSSQVYFGDFETTADENADAVYDYINYREGWEQPEYTAAAISDLAFWSKDMSEQFAKINSIGLQAAIGLRSLPTVERAQAVGGVEAGPTISSTSYVPLADMALFTLGSSFWLSFTDNVASSVASVSFNEQITVDGDEVTASSTELQPAAYAAINNALIGGVHLDYGVHYCSVNFKVNSDSAFSNGTSRRFQVRSK